LEVARLYKLCEPPTPAVSAEADTEFADDAAAITPQAIAALAAQRVVALDTVDDVFARKDADPVRRPYL
jgi:hypothetical protein